ncbi:NACHT and WD40 repeat domain-containing protein [Streptomyces djakartensis]|uniref:NACHT domain-containing protein n=1 Tax=Streptomyces djakartensis TaxID=68193 RepID=A0ABQ2ZWX2_9ACTN|nr:WD40 repeat domain-containing protein [Streptomyces djakartensis]GGY25102.1 hypothetical protein GCM10010384_35150 [Streptomyces djakartensis]
MVLLSERNRRSRYVRTIILGLLAAVTVGLVATMAGAGAEDNNTLAAVSSLFVAIAALAVAIWDAFCPPPEKTLEEWVSDLTSTLRDQGWQEASERQLGNAQLLPIAWSATARQVSDSPAAILGRPETRGVRLLDGRLDGDFENVRLRLGEAYRGIPSGRLVVIGEPGAGKSVVALTLALGLLGTESDRAPEALPVLLPVSSWDPVRDSLDDWIAHRLAETHLPGRPDVARRLLHANLLIPILDGLDEIPESSRRSAVDKINETCAGSRRVVVTCRAAEYEDVIQGGAQVLRRAPVVEIASVSAADAIAHLRGAGLTGEALGEIENHLRNEPHGALATALATPLMVSLTRAVYQSGDRDPRELLGFDTRHKVEEHLLDHLIGSAYAPDAGAPPGPDREREGQEAMKRLMYLAKYLHLERERDLDWSVMSQRLLSRWTGPVIGIGLGVLLMVAVAAAVSVLDPKADELEDVLAVGASVGGGFAVLAMVIWYAAPDPVPGRLVFALPGSFARLRRGFGTGVGLAAVPLVPLLAAAAVTTSVTTHWSPDALHNFVMAVTAAAGAAGAVGIALAVHSWLAAPPQGSTVVSPAGLLARDRGSALTGAAAAGVVLGATGIPLAFLGSLAGELAVLLVTGWSNEPSVADLAGFLADPDGIEDSSWSPLVVAAMTVLPGLVFSILILLTRAWPRFLLVRLVLAARGQLPLRLMGFLADAQRRGLLRQSGGTYQFRHIRLQERLANKSLAQDQERAVTEAAARRRRLRAVAAGALVLCGLGLVSGGLPADSSDTTLTTGTVSAMAFSPDGNTLVTGNWSSLRRWNIEAGDERTVWDDGENRGPVVSLSSDGTTVTTQKLGGEGSDLVESWNARTGTSKGREKWPYRFPPLVLSGDGSRRAVHAEPGYVAVLDTRTGVKSGPAVHVPGLAGAYGYNDYAKVTVALSDGGKRMAVATSDEKSITVRLWDVDSGRLLLDPRKVNGIRPRVQRLMLDALGDTCALAVTDKNGKQGPVHIWHIDDRGRKVSPSTGPVSEVALSADGRRLATTDDNRAWVWDTGNGTEVADLTGPVTSIDALAISGRGDRLAASDSGLTRVWTLPAH